MSGDGEISYSEFERVMAAQLNRNYTTNELRSAFEHFDVDNSGYITAENLQEVLTNMGREFSIEDIEKMIKTVDEDGNGKISFEEFENLLLS